VARRYLFHKAGIRRYKQFSKRLKDVLAKQHQDTIIRQP
jgi:hypothetical protein